MKPKTTQIKSIPHTWKPKATAPTFTANPTFAFMPSGVLANDDEETVHISANRRYVVFTTAGYTIMSRLIEGEFLNYHNVIPAGSRTRVTIDTKEFIETIERASLIITERLKNPLRITFTEGKVVVRCQTNLGRVVDEFNAECEGDEVEIDFNNRYLLDALRNARTEKVRMEIMRAFFTASMKRYGRTIKPRSAKRSPWIRRSSRMIIGFVTLSKIGLLGGGAAEISVTTGLLILAACLQSVS